MKLRLFATVFALSLLAGLPLAPAMAVNLAAATALCDSEDDDQAIEGCTVMMIYGSEKGAALARFYNSRGIAFARKGLPELAIADFGAAARLDPRGAKAYINRCNAWSDLGEFNRSLADCTKAIDLNPKSFEAYLNRGVTFMFLEQPGMAVRDTTRAIELNPKCASAYNNRGFAREQLGETTAAIEDYEVALKLDPDLEIARANLARLRQGANAAPANAAPPAKLALLDAATAKGIGRIASACATGRPLR